MLYVRRERVVELKYESFGKICKEINCSLLVSSVMNKNTVFKM